VSFIISLLREVAYGIRYKQI